MFDEPDFLSGNKDANDDPDPDDDPDDDPEGVPEGVPDDDPDSSVESALLFIRPCFLAAPIIKSINSPNNNNSNKPFVIFPNTPPLELEEKFCASCC